MSIKKPTKKLAVEEIYTSYTDHEHILKLPDTYIGSVEEDSGYMWIYSDDSKMEFKEIKYVPGLYKIFDEILVNARDHRIKDPTCTIVRVTITKDVANGDLGTITVWNNGDNGIPVEFHKKEQCYVPEMIFSKIRTSSHYGQTNKTVGGKNGIGAKAANIFSSHFQVEIVDAHKNLKYVQNFRDNMYKIEKPQIDELSGKKKSYTQITFTPDYNRFGVSELSDDVINLFKKRVYDIAAITNIKVYLNEELINIKSFSEYIEMYSTGSAIYEEINDRWKVGVVYDPEVGYRQISYVNGICTYHGGTHVAYVQDQIIKAVHAKIVSRCKTLKITPVKPAAIKEYFTIFIDCVIDDPSFSSQTKETLTTKVLKFGSVCEIGEKFIKRVLTTGIVENIVKLAQAKGIVDLKKNDGKKKDTLKGLEKLEDAHDAGTRKGKDCTLILTEGDSAKACAMAGREVMGNEKYGVFPLRGKLLNVREATQIQLKNNEEIKNIVKIMGLKYGQTYKNVSQLRYGRIMILTDQDYDGSHIKGLVMNFIDEFWPSLLANVPGFITSMLTPIIKVWLKSDIKKTKVRSFYTMTEYYEWKKSVDNINKYTVKYYKGLGTSTATEAKEYFQDFDNKLVHYMWATDPFAEVDDDTVSEMSNTANDLTDVKVADDTDYKAAESHLAIALAFAKDRIDDRKEWLQQYNKDIILENTEKRVLYKDFINKDLIHFSNYDIIRSIPSICDGLKPSIRKIIYGCYLKRLFKPDQEIKVAQLAGFVSERTGYHHGESSLHGAIIGLAQNFVGSNNINWLFPSGEFGNRTQGGENAASERYIYTYLSEVTPYVFRKEDECVYTYVDDDGTTVEPETYAPIICTTLINGTKGIGTGFSTTIQPYNPLDIIKNQRRMLAGKKPVSMTPWFRGFKGQIIKNASDIFESHGIYEIVDENTINITELPIGLWTENYKKYLDTLVADDPKSPKEGHILRKVIHNSGLETINITLIFFDGQLQSLIKKNEIEKRFKLVKSHNTSNMHLYDSTGTLKKYNTVEEILTEYHQFRLAMYHKRKEHYSKLLQHQLLLLEWRVKFIEYVITERIIVFENKRARSEENVIAQLVSYKFPKLSTNVNSADESKSYDYLTSITIFSLTDEKKAKLQAEYDAKLAEYNTYQETSVEDIWTTELDEFEAVYNKWVIASVAADTTGAKTKGKGKGNGKGRATKLTIKTA